ncbi:restriction endonuclease subunit S [Catenibacterium mitsuokai]|uniref:restriction endonuclease subunit S n=1 Tax=Catenibacterium mitsuokai TaxID=100886 RepID=UPI001C394F1B|nr:restriction endonuclease subunit S [Catenibacterium mitsuokai]MBV3377388.1 restriction endonuclease subunit S [Catenibacterium mitsuokai]
MEKSRKPKIRFKGYNDDWEQRKLGEVANYRRGSFPQPYGNSEWYDGEGAMPFVQVADVTDNMNLVEDTKQKISKLAQPMSVYAEKDAVLVTLQGSIGRVAIAQYGAFVDRTVLIFEKYKEKIDYSFWAYIVKQKFIEESRKAPGGTIKTITKEALSDFDLYIPQYQEQRRIAEFFKNIDNLITLHQRKLDKLINVKKSMLEKMFPKQGSIVPEIRFNGFTQAWEQREFSKIFDCTISNNTLSRSELSYEEGSILNIHYGDILIKYGSILDIHKYKIPRIPNKKKEDFKGSLLQPGDVVIADTAEDETTGKACEIGSLFGNSIVAGLHTMVARPNIEMASGYLGYYLNSNAYHCQLLPMMQGIKVLSLSRANVKKTVLKFPESTKEQQLIANYFIQLDELITLHQRKLEKLKNIKKSMLEKMFV